MIQVVIMISCFHRPFGAALLGLLLAATPSLAQSPPDTCFALILSHSGPGVDPVASPPDSGGCPSGMYTAGTSVQLTAFPAAGATVAGWTDTLNDLSTSSSNTTTEQQRDTEVGVAYSACLALSISHTGSGSDPATNPTSSPGCVTGSYIFNAGVQFTADPAPGWIVAGWTGTDNNMLPSTANDVDIFSTTPEVSVAYQQSGYYTVPPCRLIDTREPTDPLGALAPSSLREFIVSGLTTQCGIPTAATAISINVTVTQPQALGFLTVFPSDALPASATSTLNFGAGQTRANNAVLGLFPHLGLGEYFTTFEAQNGSAGSLQLIVDVSGYFQ
jgi:hypothetical protein